MVAKAFYDKSQEHKTQKPTTAKNYSMTQLFIGSTYFYSLLSIFK